MEKLKHAIMYREAGSHPIPDEEFEADIKEIIDLLKQVKQGQSTSHYLMGMNQMVPH